MKRKIKSGVEGVCIPKNNFRVSATRLIKLEGRAGRN